jgi:ketosteroid isomerase-like protein
MTRWIPCALLAMAAPILYGADDSPKAALDELVAADRAFSAASATTDVVSGLSAMFADDVVMPAPPGILAQGRAAAIEALRANPDNATSRIEWAPARAAISADGLHGFTAGFMMLRRSANATMPLKYLAYWVKQPSGWRVAAYKRSRGAGDPPHGAVVPILPERMVTPTSDRGAIAHHAQSLDAGERAFSDEAQSIGLGPAFAKYGGAHAINLGGPDDAGLIVGADAIARSVAAGGPPAGSAVSWSPDRVIVASSGDLGVSIGTIRRNAPTPGQPAAFPFFTVWRRVSPSASWRYIAE